MGWLFDLDEEIDDDRDPVPLMQAMADVLSRVTEAWSDKPLKDPELSRLPYAEYLESSHWIATRQRARLRAGGICQRCHVDGRPLDVHHLTYVRLGREAESDLIVLCRQCHAAEHGVPA